MKTLIFLMMLVSCGKDVVKKPVQVQAQGASLIEYSCSLDPECGPKCEDQDIQCRTSCRKASKNYPNLYERCVNQNCTRQVTCRDSFCQNKCFTMGFTSSDADTCYYSCNK